MRKVLSILIFILIPQIIFSQYYTISGYVVDKETGETLIGATVIIEGTHIGVATDQNGYFRIAGLKPGEYLLKFAYLGFQKVEKKIKVENKSILLNETPLTPEAVSLDAVTITDFKPDSIGDREIETSHLKLSAQTIQNIPSGKNDVFRAIKYLPGVEATDPFSPLYSARGNEPAGNLVLLDGVAIYNPYHFATADGLFNVKTIKDVDLMVGGFGAEFGGRNASILYITTKDGNRNALHGEVEPTTTHTRFFLEFPAGDKGSMTIAGRAFYDVMSYFIFSSKSYFYDVNLSYTGRLNERNRLTLKLFNSNDNFKYQPDRLFTYFDNSFNTDIYEDTHMLLKNKWSNKAATAILKTIITPDVYLKTQVYGSFHTASNLSGFDMMFNPDSTNETIKLYYNTNFSSKINDLCAKTTLNIKFGSLHTVKVGAEINGYYFKNSANINDVEKGISVRKPYLLSEFIEDKIKFGNFSIRPGIRISKYSFWKNWQFEPRVNAVANLFADIKLKAAWGVFYQNIISMNTQEYEINQFLDYYYPLMYQEPSKSIHYIAGIEKPFSHSSLSLDFYYIDMPVTYTFNLNQSEFEAQTFSDKLEKGTGKSYGFELMWKADFKRLSGWVSYKLGRSTRSYPHIMEGKSFLFDFDRLHSFKTVINYRIAPRLTYNFSLVVLSGLPKTIETNLQSYYYYDPVSGSLSSYPFGVAPNKNNARLPSTIELDMGIVKRVRKGFGAELVQLFNANESYLTITIGNILFLRRNVIWYFPYGGKRYIPIGLNFFPQITAGYIIKF